MAYRALVEIAVDSVCTNNEYATHLELGGNRTKIQSSEFSVLNIFCPPPPQYPKPTPTSSGHSYNTRSASMPTLSLQHTTARTQLTWSSARRALPRVQHTSPNFDQPTREFATAVRSNQNAYRPVFVSPPQKYLRCTRRRKGTANRVHMISTSCVAHDRPDASFERLNAPHRPANITKSNYSGTPSFSFAADMLLTSS